VLVAEAIEAPKVGTIVALALACSLDLADNLTVAILDLHQKPKERD